MGTVAQAKASTGSRLFITGSVLVFPGNALIFTAIRLISTGRRLIPSVSSLILMFRFLFLTDSELNPAATRLLLTGR